MFEFMTAIGYDINKDIHLHKKINPSETETKPISSLESNEPNEPKMTIRKIKGKKITIQSSVNIPETIPTETIPENRIEETLQPMIINPTPTEPEPKIKFFKKKK